MGLSISSKSVPFYIDLEDFHRISSESYVSDPHLEENKRTTKTISHHKKILAKACLAGIFVFGSRKVNLFRYSQLVSMIRNNNEI